MRRERNENLQNRKHPRLKNYDYSQSGYYHITICLADDAPVMSTVGRELAPAAEKAELTETGKIIEKHLLAVEGFFENVQVDRYVIMPDHIHAIIKLADKTAGASSRPTLMRVVQVFKSKATRECNINDKTPGRKIFQTSFYDEIIKNEKAYNEISKYIYENPLKKVFENKNN